MNENERLVKTEHTARAAVARAARRLALHPDDPDVVAEDAAARHALHVARARLHVAAVAELDLLVADRRELADLLLAG